MVKLIKKNKTKIKKQVHQTAEESLVSWTTTDRVDYIRGKLWYALFFLIFTSLIVLSFLYGSWSFGLVLIAVIAAYGFTHLKPPKKLEVSFTKSKIKIGKKSYTYSQIRNFWIITEPPFNTIFFNIPGTISSPISVEISRDSAEFVREFLIRKIPEIQNKSASFSDTLIRLLKL